MLVWINGTFGVGKTTTAKTLVEMSDGLRLFDPEWVGYLLTAHLHDRQIGDFQDLPAWRRLVPVVAGELAAESGDRLVAVQTVLEQPYWHEIADGLRRTGQAPFHVVLDVTAELLHERIDADSIETDAAQWRHDHVDAYLAARSWMTDTADLVVDTGVLSATEAAVAISAAMR